MKQFLPISREEMDERGWDAADVIIISADAYVDHPSFGHAVVSRLLEHEGLRVAILPQPNWRDDLRDFKKLGRPRLFFGISSGMDSMVNHYTAAKRLRSEMARTAAWAMPSPRARWTSATTPSCTDSCARAIRRTAGGSSTCRSRATGRAAP